MLYSCLAKTGASDASITATDAGSSNATAVQCSHSKHCCCRAAAEQQESSSGAVAIVVLPVLGGVL
jgi:hypothetical protein